MNTDPKSPGQIRQQLKQVMFRHLQRELRESFKVTPEGCCHNAPVGLGSNGQVHLCHLKVDGKPRKMLCDSRQWGGQRQARNCPDWAPARDKDTIKAQFKALVAGPRGELAAQYPDIAALLWVLDSVDGSFLDETIASVEVDEAPAPPETAAP